MDGWTKIREAYRRGLKPHQVYKPYDPLYRELRRFIDRDYFGLLRWDDVKQKFLPKHVNSDANPFPAKDHKGRPVRRLFRKSDWVCHLFAQKTDERPGFAFMVNSPKSAYHLLCIDIDGDDPDITGPLAARVVEEVLPDQIVFTERSRNRKGMYIWMIVHRTSSPGEFNSLMNALGTYLRSRFTVDDRNKVDAVKATLHYHEGCTFTRAMSGNPNDNHRGVLATMPLSGSLNDGPDGDRMRGVFLEFVRRNKTRQYVNAIEEYFFRAIVPSLNLPITAALDADAPVVVSSPPPSFPTKTYTSEFPTKESVNGLSAIREKTKAEASPIKRMRLASSLFYHHHGHYAEDADTLVRYYEANGFNTGEDKDGRRTERATQALERHRATERPRKPIRFKMSDYLPMVEKYVTDAIKASPAIKYRYRVDDRLIAIALYTYTVNAFAPKPAERMHTCPDDALKAMYAKMADAAVITKAVKDKEKRVAIRQMLQLAGLIVLRDGNHRHRGPLKGIADKFGLGPHHDRYQEFVARYGHVVDPRNLTLADVTNAA